VWEVYKLDLVKVWEVYKLDLVKVWEDYKLDLVLFETSSSIKQIEVSTKCRLGIILGHCQNI